MKQTRREAITSLASILAGVGWSSDDAHASPFSDTINTPHKQMDGQNKKMKRNAYVALPGVAYTTLFANLPLFLNNRVRQPRIIIDSFDYHRLQGRVLKEPNNQEVQIRGAICDALRRRGIIKTIDYTDFYPIEKQNRNINRYWEATYSLPEHVIRDAAEESNGDYLNFGRGDYQQPFRSALGNWDINIDRRKEVKKQQRRFKRGTGGAHEFNENIFAQYIAGLEVRNALNAVSDMNISGVIGHGDEGGISTMLSESDVTFDTDVLTLDQGGESIEQIARPHHDHIAKYHDVFDTIREVAQETTGVQHNDWFQLGPRLAVPIFPKLFSRAKGINGVDRNPEGIVVETRQILSHLNKEATKNSPSHVQYKSEKISEESETEHTADEIEEHLRNAADLSNHADDIRELKNKGKFSEGALFVAATVKMDPQYRYNEDDLYRRSVDLQQQRRQINVSDEDIEFFRNRGQFRRGNGDERDWYHVANRGRISH